MGYFHFTFRGKKTIKAERAGSGIKPHNNDWFMAPMTALTGLAEFMQFHSMPSKAHSPSPGVKTEEGRLAGNRSGR